MLATSFGTCGYGNILPKYCYHGAANSLDGNHPFTFQIFLILPATLVYGHWSGESVWVSFFPKNFDFPYISPFNHGILAAMAYVFGPMVPRLRLYPLGGNRKDFPRQLVNILIVWLLTGFWHGASWNFILWGLYFARSRPGKNLFTPLVG